jgi:hypothetical protein
MMAGTELVELLATSHAEPRLQRVFGVIDAGMDDAAVAGAGAMSRARLLFENAHPCAALRQRQPACQADHAGADHGDIDIDLRHDLLIVCIVCGRTTA